MPPSVDPTTAPAADNTAPLPEVPATPAPVAGGVPDLSSAMSGTETLDSAADKAVEVATPMVDGAPEAPAPSEAAPSVSDGLGEVTPAEPPVNPPAEDVPAPAPAPAPEQTEEQPQTPAL